MLFLNSFRGMARRAAAHRPGAPALTEPQRRLRIHRSLFIVLAALTSACLALMPSTHAADDDDDEDDNHRTYTVLVGAEDVDQGASITAFFPETLRIHVGDTVHWRRNTDEIHTVTFLAGTPLPPFAVPTPPELQDFSPTMRNPLVTFPTAPAHGRYDGTSFANSGVFGPDEFQVDSFDLTFTRAGTYNYVCVVHGVRMSGQVIVVDRDDHVPSPRQVDQEARRLIVAGLDDARAALDLVEDVVPPPTQNDDGTTTYHVLVGYAMGSVDLLHFFPDELTVHPGDTVEWMFTMEDMDPHTITFLNGNPDVDLVIPFPQDNGPPLLVNNPEFLFPQNADEPLNRQDFQSSGRLAVADPPPSFSLVIGDISGDELYQCLIHDGSGMLGMLHIVPR